MKRFDIFAHPKLPKKYQLVTRMCFVYLNSKCLVVSSEFDSIFVSFNWQPSARHGNFNDDRLYFRDDSYWNFVSHYFSIIFVVAFYFNKIISKETKKKTYLRSFEMRFAFAAFPNRSQTKLLSIILQPNPTMGMGSCHLFPVFFYLSQFFPTISPPLRSWVFFFLSFSIEMHTILYYFLAVGSIKMTQVRNKI